MNARGSTEVIVASIGLSIGVLNQDLFTSIVTMAVVTTMSMPPMLRWALGRVSMGPEEATRLEREEVEARGFVAKIERVLVANRPPRKAPLNFPRLAITTNPKVRKSRFGWTSRATSVLRPADPKNTGINSAR